MATINRPEIPQKKWMPNCLSTPRLDCFPRLLILLLVCQVAMPTFANASEASQTVQSLGLRESKVAARDMPGWTRPERIVIRGDSDRVAWLEEVIEGVELIPVSDHAAAIEKVVGADAIIGYCSDELLAAGKDLKWIQLPYAGAERCLAVEAIHQRSLLLTNAQRIYGPEIAEHVIAVMLAFSRGLNVFMHQQAKAAWNPDAIGQESSLWELSGKTMLIAGLGGIGTEVARRAHALGMTVTATRASSREGPDFVSYVGLSDELQELAAKADVVVNSLPLTPKTTDLFNAAFFSAMKPTAYFINVGRGKSVVTDDLVFALGDGQIAGAGLDVTEPEPLPSDHPLWIQPNVIITPHISAGSDLRSKRLWIVMRENLRRYVAGEPMLSVVDIDRGY
jgi:phosphoglycerate dehydrogenase-like enzyme